MEKLWRVLIVDDRPDMLQLMSINFEEAGANVVQLSNPEEALAMVTKSVESGDPYDMVISDIMMPEMNGFELTKKLRAAGYAGPIVAFTATVSGHGRKEGSEAGITTYLSKDTLKPNLVTALLETHCPKK